MSDSDRPDPSRRRVFAVAGAAGALAATAAVVPKAAPPAVPAAGAAAAEPRTGYQVTAHVLRYYQTARV